MSFGARVLATVRRVPAGRVATYGDIALLAGSPRAWRAVGSILRECRDPGVPCHRIIAAGGGLGGYGSNLQVKRVLLRAEGLDVGMTRVRRFSEVRWTSAPTASGRTLPAIRSHRRLRRASLPATHDLPQRDEREQQGRRIGNGIDGDETPPGRKGRSARWQ